MKQTPLVHEELAQCHLLPQTHLVVAGYVDAGLLVESRESYGVNPLGPASRNNQWQAKAGKGYDLLGFAVDFVAREATCPQGYHKLSIRFAEQTCRECLCRSLCSCAEAPAFIDSFSRRVSSAATQAQATRHRGLSGHLC